MLDLICSGCRLLPAKRIHISMAVDQCSLQGHSLGFYKWDAKSLSDFLLLSLIFFNSENSLP